MRSEAATVKIVTFVHLITTVRNIALYSNAGGIKKSLAWFQQTDQEICLINCVT